MYILKAIRRCLMHILEAGTAVGSLLGGFIFQNYGGAIMYRSFGIYTLIFGILYSSIHAFMDRKKTMTRKGNF